MCTYLVNCTDNQSGGLLLLKMFEHVKATLRRRRKNFYVFRNFQSILVAKLRVHSKFWSSSQIRTGDKYISCPLWCFSCRGHVPCVPLDIAPILCSEINGHQQFKTSSLPLRPPIFQFFRFNHSRMPQPALLTIRFDTFTQLSNVYSMVLWPR